MGAAATKRGDRNIRRQIDAELEAKRDATEFTRIIEENHHLRQELRQARVDIAAAGAQTKRLRVYRAAAEEEARVAQAEAAAARVQAEANQAWRDHLLQGRTQELQAAQLRIQKLSAYLRCCPADVVESAKIDARCYYPQLWPVAEVVTT